MSNNYRKIDANEFELLAAEYIVECENNRKEVLSNKGDIKKIHDRKIADWKYFVCWWLKKKDIDFYTREYTYDIEKNLEHPLSYTIKKVKAIMDGYSSDVVANEGKGIFWAKNRLGMTDRQEQKTDSTIRFIDDDDKTTEATQITE